MGSKVSISVNSASLGRAIRAIRLFTKSKDNAIRAVIAETAIAIDAEAKRLAPVDTGRLRASIHPEFSADGLSASVSTNVEYAVSVEFGTRKQRAQPFLFPAAESQRKSFIANLKRVLTTI